MFYHLSLIIYLSLFAFIAWRRFHLGLALFFLLLPTYLIRFSIGPLPTTLLEVMLWIITVIWIAKDHKSITHHLSSIIRRHKLLSIAITLFLLAATVSIFTSTNIRGALGEWKTFYLEPIALFFILTTTLSIQQSTNTHKISNFKFLISNRDLITHHLSPITPIIIALTLSGLITSLLAIYQHFTGWMVPDAFWTNQNTFRVTAWYGFPNAVGLFLAPIIPLAIYLIVQNLSAFKRRNWKLEIRNWAQRIAVISSFLFLISSPLAIYFARSTGALVGLAAGLLFFLFFYNKKSRFIACLVILVSLVSLVILPPSNPVKQELFLHDRSGQIRLAIWEETTNFLKDNPIWGAGLASYQDKIKPYHTTVNGEGIEIFHHPHNIFLTMWTNLGLLGVLAFILIVISFFKTGMSKIENWKLEIGKFEPFVLSSVVVILVAGLVDSPYIKNDLAMLFWLLPALLIMAQQDDEFIPQ